MVERLKSLAPERIVLEATGGYEQAVAGDNGQSATGAGFCQGPGRLAKTDPIDPEVLMRFAEAIHSLEILVNQTVEVAPLILLGCGPQTIAIKGIIDAVWGMYIHSNINVRAGFVQYIINGPEMHRWHHAVDEGARPKFRNEVRVLGLALRHCICPEEP